MYNMPTNIGNNNRKGSYSYTYQAVKLFDNSVICMQDQNDIYVLFFLCMMRQTRGSTTQQTSILYNKIKATQNINFYSQRTSNLLNGEMFCLNDVTKQNYLYNEHEIIKMKLCIFQIQYQEFFHADISVRSKILEPLALQTVLQSPLFFTSNALLDSFLSFHYSVVVLSEVSSEASNLFDYTRVIMNKRVGK